MTSIKQQQSPTKLISASELINRKIDDMPTLIHPILPKVGLVAFAGSSDTGKSMLARQLCIHVVSGEEYFLGFRINATHGKAIYVSTEDDENAIAYLLRKQNAEGRYPPEKLINLNYLFEFENLIEQLDEVLSKEKVDLVVIDVLSDLTGGIHQGDSSGFRSFLRPYNQLAQKHQCLILFLHHTGKKTEMNEPSKNNLLGSQGIESKMRAVVELRQDPLDPSKRHFCIVKGNYLPHQYKTESFVLRLNPNMLFSATAERIPFRLLAKQDPQTSSLSERDSAIKSAYAEGKKVTDLAEQFQLSKGQISKIIHKETQ